MELASTEVIQMLPRFAQYTGDRAQSSFWSVVFNVIVNSHVEKKKKCSVTCGMNMEIWSRRWLDRQSSICGLYMEYRTQDTDVRPNG